MKMKKRNAFAILLICILFFSTTSIIYAKENNHSILKNVINRTIEGNGTGSIYIDLNVWPYTDPQYSYSNNQYTNQGCTWFATSRAVELTEKIDIVIKSGTARYRDAVEDGFKIVEEPTSNTFICFSGHIAICEKVEDGFAYISEGGHYAGNNTTGFCRIFKIDINTLKNTGYNSTGAPIGYVYFGDYVKPNTYQVSFDSNGGTGTMENQTLEYNTEAKLIKNTFVKEYYTFKNWNTKEDGTGTSYSDQENVKNIIDTDNETITLYAQWSKTKYEINYELDGGKNHKDNPLTYTYHPTKTIKLHSPTKKGYIFKGWYSNKKCTKEIASFTRKSAKEITIYAKWEPIKYTIKFDDNGANKGFMSKQKNLKYGSSYKLSKNKFSRKGYEFVGWNTKENGSGTFYENKSKVKNLSVKDGTTITLYAQWEKIKYTITYDLNGGKNHKDNIKKTSYTITSSTYRFKNPTRKGYVFKGWYSDKKFKHKINQIKKGSTGDKTLYACWEAKKYHVKFHGNSATSGSMKKLRNKDYGKTFKLTENKFKRTGYTFVGWNTKKNGTGKQYDNNAKVKNLTSKNDETITLYAQWEKKKYTITYYLNGGKNHEDNRDYYHSTTANFKLKSPNREGYIFKGWYTDKNLKKKQGTIKKGSTKNIKVYAKWQAIKYKIVFNSNGATSGSMKSMNGCVYDKSYTLTANSFIKNNCEFLGWNTKADGSGISYKDKDKIKNLCSTNGKTIILYAQWKDISSEPISYRMKHVEHTGDGISLSIQQSDTLFEAFNLNISGTEMKIARISNDATYDFNFEEQGISKNDILGIVIGWTYWDSESKSFCDADYIASIENANDYEYGYFNYQAIYDKNGSIIDWGIPAKWSCSCFNSIYKIETLNDEIYSSAINIKDYVTPIKDNEYGSYIYFITVVYKDYSFTVCPFVFADEYLGALEIVE